MEVTVKEEEAWSIYFVGFFPCLDLAVTPKVMPDGRDYNSGEIKVSECS